MKTFSILLLFLIPIAFISGCYTEIQTTGETIVSTPTSQPELKEKVETGVTGNADSVIQPDIEEKVETEITSTESETGPRTFHVNIVQGFGITTGAG